MNNDVCRLCSKCDGTLIDVFNNDLDTELCNKIGVCFGILIFRDDQITKKVCKQCYFLTNSYSELRVSAINNDTKLKREYEERLKNENVKQDIRALISSRSSSPSSKASSLISVKNEKENKTKEKPIKLKTVPVIHNKIVGKENDQVVDPIRNEPPATKALIEPGPMEVIPELPIPPAVINPIESNPKKTHHHPSINKIKRILPGIKIPRKYWHLNFDPVLNITKLPEDIVSQYKFSLWTVNVNNHKRPVLHLRRVSRNVSKSDKDSDFEFDFESDASEASKRSEQNVNCDMRSESSFCASPTPERDIQNKNKRPRPWRELSPSDLNNIIDHRNRSCKLTGKNVYTELTEEMDEDDFEDEIHEKKSKRSKNENMQNGFQVQGENLSPSNDDSFVVNSDNLLLFDTNKVCKTFICQTCSKLFDTHKALKDHQRQHLKNTLRCFKCSKSFPIVEDLIQHNLTVHSKDSTGEDSNNLVDTPMEGLNPSYIAKKSTCQVPKNISVAAPVTGKESPVVNDTKVVGDVVDLSSDDDCEFVSVQTSNTNTPNILQKNKQKSPILENVLNNSNNPKGVSTVTKTQLDIAIKSITPKVLGPKNSVEATEPDSTRSFEDISKENKLTSVNICDEEYYLKYVFEKNIKGQKQPESYTNYICQKQEDIRMWYLRDMDKLLEKSFIPVDFVPGNFNGVSVKYTYSGNKRVKPKSTTYKWSALNAVDIPKNDVDARKTNSDLSPLSSVLSTNGEIYTIPTNMEIVGVTHSVNDTNNSKTNFKGYKLTAPPHLRYIAPKTLGKNIGQSTNIKEFNKNNPNVVNKNLLSGNTIREQFIAKVQSDGRLTLLPTSSLQVIPNQPSTSTGSNILLSNQTKSTSTGSKIIISTTKPSTTGSNLILSTTQPSTSGTNIVLSTQTQPSPSSSNLLLTTQPSTSGASLLLSSQTQPSPNILLTTQTKPVNVSTLKDLNLFNHQSVVPNPDTNKSNLYPQIEPINIVPLNTETTQPVSTNLTPPPTASEKPTPSTSSTKDVTTSTPPPTVGKLRIKTLSELTEKPQKQDLQAIYVQTLANYVNSCPSSSIATNISDNNSDNEYLQIS